MVNRLVIALVGASTITLGLLYGMSEITEIFQRRDPTQYFQITDVLLRPDDAKPRRIPRAGVQPERGAIEFERPDVAVGVERPSVELDGSNGTPPARPQLDAGSRGD